MNLYVKSQNCPEGASYAVSYGNLGKAEDGVSGYLREVPWKKKKRYLVNSVQYYSGYQQLTNFRTGICQTVQRCGFSAGRLNAPQLDQRHYLLT